MTDKEMIPDALKKNNGVIETKQFAERGIDNKVFRRLEQEGKIERISKGIYIDVEQMVDDYLIMQYRCKKGIFSHETALFLHDLCDRSPLKLMMTIPTGYNTRLLKLNDYYQFFYMKKEFHEIGKMNVQSPYGHTIVVYDKERTICDCLKKRDKLDTDIALAAVRQYMRDPERDFIKLQLYADVFKISALVHQYMEVLA
nr:type IV toxin-antitoxin system AbiEi family antitoxin domain-containing protein [uncultured Acetobacterium sp.]